VVFDIATRAGVGPVRAAEIAERVWFALEDALPAVALPEA
jgi:hypothetical protein